MSTEVTTSAGWNLLTLPLETTGQVEKVKVRFLGEGSIEIQEIRFNMPAHSGLDFSTSEVTTDITTNKWDSGILSHNTSLSAGSLAAKFNKANREVVMSRYYFDALLSYHKKGEGNIDLTGKSKIVIIYNNMGTVSGLNLGLGIVDVTEDDSWKIAHAEISNNLVRGIALKTEMARGEWAAVEIDLAQYIPLTNGTDGKAINEIGIQQNYTEAAGEITVSSDVVNIRAIIII